jgi:ribosomal protein S12 methylthiotransferase accessory factor
VPSLLERTTGPTPLAESVARFRSLVSPFTGLVRTAEQMLAAPDDARLVHVECTTGDCTALTGVHGAVTGGGSGRSLDAALVAAVAEVAERYSAGWSCDREAVVATAEELGGEAVTPERFALFSDRQYALPRFPFAPFTSRTPVAWVRGVSLPDAASVWLPAQLVYLGWTLRAGESPIATATSSGLAAHATPAEAVLSALLELLERDAFMITWGARLSWPHLHWPEGHPLARFHRRNLRPTGLDLSSLDLSRVWEVPCVLAVARSTAAGEARLGVGAAAAATIERAAEKALDEAVRVRSWARAMRALDPDGAALREPDDIVHFSDHVAWYARDEHAARAAFLTASEATQAVEDVRGLTAPDVGEQLAELCRRLAARGTSAYATDVTAPDVRAAGVVVARVVAPELCPLDVVHRMRYLGGSRRYDVPAQLGLRSRRLAEEELNPDPHPFP